VTGVAPNGALPPTGGSVGAIINNNLCKQYFNKSRDKEVLQNRVKICHTKS
jgi:hypothetical protein